MDFKKEFLALIDAYVGRKISTELFQEFKELKALEKEKKSKEQYILKTLPKSFSIDYSFDGFGNALRVGEMELEPENKVRWRILAGVDEKDN